MIASQPASSQDGKLRSQGCNLSQAIIFLSLLTMFLGVVDERGDMITQSQTLRRNLESHPKNTKQAARIQPDRKTRKCVHHAQMQNVPKCETGGQYSAHPRDSLSALRSHCKSLIDYNPVTSLPHYGLSETEGTTAPHTPREITAGVGTRAGTCLLGIHTG